MGCYLYTSAMVLIFQSVPQLVSFIERLSAGGRVVMRGSTVKQKQFFLKSNFVMTKIYYGIGSTWYAYVQNIPCV